MIDGGYGGDVLKFDGTLYRVTECFSHDYKKIDDIHPSNCQSVGSSIAQPARDDVQVSNPVLAPAPPDSNSTPSTTPMESTNPAEPNPSPTTSVMGESGSSSAVTWTDPATGQMWTARDNGRDVNWNEATNYCANLNLGGYSNWRLPRIEELQGIYDPRNTTAIRRCMILDVRFGNRPLKLRLTTPDRNCRQAFPYSD